MVKSDKVRHILEVNADRFNTHEFIANDPLSVPHLFALKQDIEIAGFFAAIFSWGQRKTIIAKSLFLMDLMGNQPYDFILNAGRNELKPLENFVHSSFRASTTAPMMAIRIRIETTSKGSRNSRNSRRPMAAV